MAPLITLSGQTDNDQILDTAAESTRNSDLFGSNSFSTVPLTPVKGSSVSVASQCSPVKDSSASTASQTSPRKVSNKPFLPLKGGECQFKVCHYCRPSLLERSFLSLNSIVNNDIPPSAIIGFGFHLSGKRPVSLVKHAKNLGLRPNPTPVSQIEYPTVIQLIGGIGGEQASNVDKEIELQKSSSNTKPPLQSPQSSQYNAGTWIILTNRLRIQHHRRTHRSHLEYPRPRQYTFN